jgi:hypothetical protein
MLPCAKTSLQVSRFISKPMDVVIMCYAGIVIDLFASEWGYGGEETAKTACRNTATWWRGRGCTDEWIRVLLFGVPATARLAVTVHGAHVVAVHMHMQWPFSVCREKMLMQRVWREKLLHFSGGFSHPRRSGSAHVSSSSWACRAWFLRHAILFWRQFFVSGGASERAHRPAHHSLCASSIRDVLLPTKSICRSQRLWHPAVWPVLARRLLSQVLYVT